MDGTLTARAEQLARELATAAGAVDELNALMRTMMKSALERMLDAETVRRLPHDGLDGSTADLKAIDTSATVLPAERQLDTLTGVWGRRTRRLFGRGGCGGRT